jgi:paraquat-inducible protein B
MVLSIIFLEDKQTMLLHLSIFYEYQQFVQHPICFWIQTPITNETTHVTTHATHSDP